jgi:hypothetical protein
MEEKKFELLAKVVEDEVCTYLKNTRCVNKMDIRTQLAIRVLDLIAKFEQGALEAALDRDELTDEEKSGIGNEANKLRELVYQSLKEY